MRSLWTIIEIQRRWFAIAGLMAGLSLAPVCWAQDAAPPPAPPQQKPGVFDSIGRFFETGASNFRDHLRGAKRKMDELGDDAAANNKAITDRAAKVGQGAAEVGKGAADATINAVGATTDAVDAVAKLPTARMMSGRERCNTAPNGAPDCVSAAEALCRKHGFTTGKSMDFTSADECPVKTLVGQSDECTTVTFISRAMCQ
jgi:hypothetical protein